MWVWTTTILYYARASLPPPSLENVKDLKKERYLHKVLKECLTTAPMKLPFPPLTLIQIEEISRPHPVRELNLAGKELPKLS